MTAGQLRGNRGRAALLAALLTGFALVLLAVELRWGPLHRLDLRIVDDLHRSALHHPGAVTWWLWVSRVLNPTVERIAYGVVVVLLMMARRWSTALFVAATMIGEAVLDSATKAIVGRHRPSFVHPVAHAAGAAFPSGHALGATVSFGLLVLLVPRRWKPAAAILAVLATGLVSFSRLALGVHFLSDVVAGWLLGGAWLALMAWCAAAGLFTLRSPRAPAQPASDPPRGTPTR